MTFYINSVCNLNCKGCAHFAPLAKSWKIKLEDFKNEANLISKLCEPEQISILGGETLLHEDLDKILFCARKIFKNQKISFVTNGILLNNHFDEHLFASIKKNNINIRFSVYPIDVNYELIFKKLKILNISYDTENDFVNNQNEVLKFTYDPIVSSDIIGNACGCLVDGLSTKVLDINKREIKVVAWYDNEYGYSAQMLRTMDKLLKL